MRKTALILVFLLSALTVPARAQSDNLSSLGSMYTDALNNIEAKSLLDSLEPPRHTAIKDMYLDHGQVIVMLTDEEGRESTIAYDPTTDSLVRPSP